MSGAGNLALRYRRSRKLRSLLVLGRQFKLGWMVIPGAHDGDLGNRINDLGIMRKDHPKQFSVYALYCVIVMGV